MGQPVNARSAFEAASAELIYITNRLVEFWDEMKLRNVGVKVEPPLIGPRLRRAVEIAEMAYADLPMGVVLPSDGGKPCTVHSAAKAVERSKKIRALAATSFGDTLELTGTCDGFPTAVRRTHQRSPSTTRKKAKRKSRWQ